MISNEEDKDSIEKSIKDIENKLQATSDQAYELSMKRKFLYHQLADLNYELRQKDDI